jgi:hypothetical protein
MPTPTNQFRLKLQPNFVYNFSIDWGDGSREIFQGTTSSIEANAGITHTYATAGVQTIGITENVVGGFPKTFFNAFFNNDANNDAVKVRNIKQWGLGKWQALGRSYANCINLQIAATDHPTSTIGQITNFNYAFYNCISLTNFPQLDTSNGTNFTATWMNCSNITNFPLLNLNKMSQGTDCFNGVKIPTQTYSSMLTALAESNLNTNVVFHAGSQSYYFPWAQASRDVLTNNRGWIITDGGSQNTLAFRKFLLNGAPNCMTFTTVPAGLNCGTSCTQTEAQFPINASVTLDSTTGTGCRISYFNTSRSVTYIYTGSSDLNFTGNGIMNTGDLIGYDSSLVVVDASAGTPYAEGDGSIRITYKDLNLVMEGNITIDAYIIPT